MSEVWRRRVWALADRTDASDRLALLALAELADAGGVCRTGQRRLARVCGVDVWVAVLVDDGRRGESGGVGLRAGRDSAPQAGRPPEVRVY